MGCVFSQKEQDNIKCILCNNTGVIKNEFVKHLQQVHQINENLDFILASSFLEVEVLYKIVSNFQEIIGFTMQFGEDVKMSYHSDEILQIKTETFTNNN